MSRQKRLRFHLKFAMYLMKLVYSQVGSSRSWLQSIEYSLMIRLCAFLLLVPALGREQVTAERTSAQAMKYVALEESTKLLHNLREGNVEAIVAKLAPKVDYYDNGQ